MALTDLSLSAEEAKESMLGYASAKLEDAPKYPYGLCIELGKESMAKLGMSSLPAVGSEMMIMAKVKVSSVSSREEQGGAESCVGLQITAMEIQGAEKSAVDKLYGKAS